MSLSVFVLEDRGFTWRENVVVSVLDYWVQTDGVFYRPVGLSVSPMSKGRLIGVASYRELKSGRGGLYGKNVTIC